MDSLRPAGTKTFLWKTGIASALNLKGGDLGFIAHGRAVVGHRQEDLLLPLNWGGIDKHVQIEIIPSAPVKQFFLTLYAMNRDATVREKLQDGKPLLTGATLTAWKHKTVDLPVLPPGLYLLEVTGDDGNGGLCAGATHWLYIGE